MKVFAHLKYLSSVEGDGPLAGELEEAHHHQDDQKWLKHLLRLINFGIAVKSIVDKDHKIIMFEVAPVAEAARGT